MAAVGLHEIVPEARGLGWDGKIYADMVRSFPSELSPYYTGRVLPVAVVAAALDLLRLPPSDDAIIWAFRVLNLCSQLVSLTLWYRIADRLQLSTMGRWLGFCGLFLTFQSAKGAWFAPVQVDQFVIALALGQILLSLLDRPVALSVLSIGGAFAWPTSALTGALLLWFRPGSRSVELPLWPVVPAALCGAVLLLLGGYPGQFGTALPSLVLASIAAAWLGIPFLRANRPALAILTFVLPVLLIWLVSNSSLNEGTSPRVLFGYIFFPDQVGKIFLPVVSLAVYFGPLFLVAMLRWRDVSKAAQAKGWTAVVLLALPLGLVTEPRYWTLTWPFIVVLTTLALEGSPKRVYYGVFALAVLFSRFWLPLRISPWDGGAFDYLDRFPKQMFFMNFGFWMNWPMFVLNSVIVAAALFGLWRLDARSRRFAADPPGRLCRTERRQHSL